MQAKKIYLSLGLSFGLIMQVHAGVDSATSNTNVNITSTTATSPHSGGLVKITVTATGTSLAWQRSMGFSAMQSMTPSALKATVKTHNVLDIPNAWLTAIDTSHTDLGSYSFAQVPVSYEAFYGEWASKYAASGSTRYEHSSHTVYYGGDNTGRNIPTTGTATYAIRAMNGYNQASPNVLDGNLTVNFATAKLNGTLSNGSGSTKSITFNNVGINLSTGVFSTTMGGTVTGIKQDNSSISGGSAQGHLFGHNGATATGSLAGIVKFTENVKYDAALGGKQSNYNSSASFQSDSNLNDEADRLQ